MKLKYFLIPALICYIGCNKTTNEPISPDAALISGKWKEVEAYNSAGGPQYRVDVNDGEEIEFLIDLPNVLPEIFSLNKMNLF